MTDMEIAKRLGKLERDNRWLKKGGFALLVMFVAMITIYATRPVPDVIKAHAFEMVDSAGKLRVFIGEIPQSHLSQITVFHANGSVGGAIVVSDQSDKPGASLQLYDRKGRATVHLYSEEGRYGLFNGLNLGYAEQNAGVGPSPNTSGINMIEGKGSSVIRMWDDKGYIMDLGSTGITTLLTGETSTTSVDSITMYGNGKKHRVIWRAP